MNKEFSILDKLTKAVSFSYKEDKTMPGVTVAALPKGQYYCSIVRYTDAFGRGKEVVCSSKGNSIADVVKATADKFLFLTSAKVVKNPIDELKDLISSEK